MGGVEDRGRGGGEVQRGNVIELRGAENHPQMFEQETKPKINQHKMTKIIDTKRKKKNKIINKICFLPKLFH